MSLNWKEIDLIISELTVTKGKIQQICQPEFHTLYLGIYADRQLQYLYFYLAQNEVRMHLKSYAAKKPQKMLRFQQLLQSRLIGATIESIEHLYKDRMLIFTCKKKVVHNTFEFLYLFARLWNNQTNIILYDSNNIIIDSLYRRPQKNIMPKEYMPVIEPPAHNREHKNESTTVREWQTIHDDSPHPFNDYIAQYYTQIHKQKYIDKRETHVFSVIQKALPYLEKTMKATKEQIEYHSQFELSLFIGNTILARIHTIKPQQEWLYVSYPNTNEPLTIHLDKTLSPAQNADVYFQKYKKSHKKLANLKEKFIDLEKNYKIITEARHLLLQIQQYQGEVSVQEHVAIPLSLNTEALLNEIIKILKSSMFANKLDARYLNTNNIKTKTQNTTTYSVTKQYKHIGIHLRTEKYMFFIGRSAKENDVLLRHVVRGNDTWMHVRGVSGSFVFIRALNKQAIPLDRLESAAQLACLFSKCKHNDTVDLHYTQVKYLRRVPKKIGLVSVQRDNGFNIVFNRNIAHSILADN